MGKICRTHEFLGLEAHVDGVLQQTGLRPAREKSVGYGIGHDVGVVDGLLLFVGQTHITVEWQSAELTQ